MTPERLAAALRLHHTFTGMVHHPRFSEVIPDREKRAAVRRAWWALEQMYPDLVSALADELAHPIIGVIDTPEGPKFFDTRHPDRPWRVSPIPAVAKRRAAA